MLQLKTYQQQTLDALQAYFQACLQFDSADTAFYHITQQFHGQGIPYRPVSELPGLPYICLRIPTGGGKTLIASHAVGLTAKNLLQTDKALVLWLVPSNAIREQTIQALKNPRHPYRQAIEAAVGSVTVLDVGEALNIQPPTLSTSTAIIISTMQAFRVEATDGRKVYEPSGALMSHFSGLVSNVTASLEQYDNGKPVPSLANVLRLHRPIIIVDEAHNARTELSFETLARFNPSCIIEFTATPDTQTNPSNVLYTVSAAELKAEDMIKMPIRLMTRPQWKELLADAIATLSGLEALAKKERQATREYIRPIMLIQAQPHYKNKPSLTVDVVEECLLNDHHIPADHIARATGSDKDLAGVDLASPDCPIRFVITVQALREGWDCPFAYVLCSVAEMHSSTAVEQILGRVLRLPNAQRKQQDDLNLAYAFAASANFAAAANELADALVQNGFERQEAKDLIANYNPQTQMDFGPLFSQPAPVTVEITVTQTPVLDNLPPETAAKVTFDTIKNTLAVAETITEYEFQAVKACLTTDEQQTFEQAYRQKKAAKATSPAERGEQFSIPVLAIKQGNLFEQLEQTHLLDYPWELSQCDALLTETEFASERPQGQKGEIDITGAGKLKTHFLSDLQEQMIALADIHGWTVADLVYWLDRSFPHPDITPTESGLFLTRVVQTLLDERQLSLDQLVQDKYRLRKVVIKKIDYHRENARRQAFQQFLLPDSATPLVVTPERNFSFDPHIYPPYNKPYRGTHKFKKHYYPQIGDLPEKGEEYECAQYIDLMPEVVFWVRNPERKPDHAFWLQTVTDKFYPDFVALLNDGRYLVVESKGDHLWSNDDSKEKRNLGELWEKRSAGRCLFIMPKGKDFAAIRAKVKQS